ncbi:probable DNA helicase MCM9 isoform X3 [Belonocnema kinseyi]|uniref:probable DNA helicase MCM9 isoform X3 n=1 Tax=Belonocnema kinseyi TaxID=2817044 RepID=UPI00143DE5ED|nr:probable DNA helicase MCM9 isoform X3 [Belonocnema kinseyi]
MLEDYFLKNHHEDLEEILNDPGASNHHSIYVNFVDLHKEATEVSNKVLRRPRHYLPLCDDSIISAQKKLASTEESKKRQAKTRVHMRIMGVPVKAHLGEIGELVTIVGIVVRMSQPIVIKLSKRYNCRKCKHVTVSHLTWERDTIPVMRECQACQSSNIELIPSLQQEDCTDQQEIKIQLYGMYILKLALAVVLAGGVTKTNSSGNKIRGEPHLLLVGDPGTGKSQILRTATRLAVRSVRTTGIGSTSAGLTAAAVKDSDGWHLEAGALVLADGGVCCVDEFATMSSHDRACVHEAMEQQTISIAKAGLVSTLNSRCSVIAAINPEGGQFKEDREYKTRLGNPLLSRFDLILLLKDTRNPSWDKMTSDHILKAARELPDDSAKRNPGADVELQKSNLWKEDELREYLAHIHSIKPILTPEADQVLQAVFLQHRYDPERRDERKTMRMLESLVRLAEGHARLMHRSEVLIMDAVVASQLIGLSTGSAKDVGCPFPHDPMANYREEGLELLNDLGLRHLERFL